MTTSPPTFSVRTLDELTIDDERACAHVELYAQLKEVLRRSGYTFRVLPAGKPARWDRALLLNLTFWGGEGDVLVDDHIAADVVAHVAWHHLAARHLHPNSAPSADALFFGEAIASAFDVYLVGHLLGHTKRSTFLDTQVPAMAETAQAAGLSQRGFDALLRRIAKDPAAAFQELRALLVDVATELLACGDATQALAVLQRHEGHRFAPLLHRYELSNWVLYARAYAAHGCAPDAQVRELDRTLRAAPDALAWLTAHWVAPTLAST